jgi:hypothetical protein
LGRTVSWLLILVVATGTVPLASTAASAETEYSIQVVSTNPIVYGAVQVDGGDAQTLPATIRVDKGASVTLTPVILDDVDYKFYSWSGDIPAAKTETLTITPEKDLTVKMNQTGKLNKTLSYLATVTSSNNAGGEKNLADGLLVTMADSVGNLGWQGTPSNTQAVTEWVEIDLGADVAFDKINIHPRTDILTAEGKTASFPSDFTLQVKVNGSQTYTTIDQKADMQAPDAYKPYVLDFAQTARYIRLEVTKVNALAAEASQYKLQLAEIAVYNTASIGKLLQTDHVNPILPLDIYIPDGEPHTWEDGRFYVYGSHDETHATYCGDNYRVFSTGDMDTWYDHGSSFKYASGTMLWAPDCVFRDGLYYLYFCVGNSWNGMAVSPYPYGPFVTPRQMVRSDNGGNLTTLHGNTDPAGFVDDDNKAYFYWGTMGAHGWGGALLDNMYTVDVPTVVQMYQYGTEYSYWEALSMRKVGNTYYSIYCSRKRHGNPNELYYATGSSPLGPFTIRGCLIDNWACADGATTHGSFDSFQGKYYLVYHKASQGEYWRRMCIEPITINEDGTIDEVIPTSQGPYSAISATNQIQAEWAATLREGSGSLRIGRYNIDEDGTETIDQIQNGRIASYKSVNFGAGVGALRVRASVWPNASQNATIEARIDSKDGPLVATVSLDHNTGGQTKYEEFVAVLTQKVTGEHPLYLVFTDPSGGVFMNLNWFVFEPGVTNAKVTDTEAGVTAAYVVANATDEALDAALLLAEHDAAGRLVRLASKAVRVESDDAVVLDDITIPATTNKVTAYIWDAATYAVLCDAATSDVTVSLTAGGYQRCVFLTFESSGATRYEVYRDNVKIGTTDKKWYADMDAAEGTDYVYTIVGLNNYGRASDVSSPVTARIDPNAESLPDALNPNKEYVASIAERGGGTRIQPGGPTGQYIDNTDVDGRAFWWENVDGGIDGGWFRFDLQFACGRATGVFKVSVNGEYVGTVALYNTGSFTNFTGVTSMYVQLNPGETNTVKFEGAANNGANVSKLSLEESPGYVPPDPADPEPVETFYMAENAQRGGGANYQNNAYGKYIDATDQNGRWFSWTSIDGGASGGAAVLKLYYGCGRNPAGVFKVYVNDERVDDLAINYTGGWTAFNGVSETTIQLKPGQTNTVRFEGAVNNGANVTKLGVTTSG